MRCTICGINGIFAYHYASNPIDRDELAKVRDHMAARGPDGKGEWVAQDGRVAFGHRRLSIIDLADTGAQPMASADGRLVVTFNGEIYNYRELRQDLAAKGRVFRSQSDTEILLHLFAEKGEAMVRDLRGMFAFAIWDSDRGQLFLARDPYGIKPLYYADDGWTLRFASQVKALLAGGAVSRDPDPAGIVGFYLLGSVPEPFTTYASIRCLPAGTTLSVDSMGASLPRRYHSIAAAFSGARRGSASAATAEDHIREELRRSVASHLVADVPVGAFLSAGVDSGALVGLMRDMGASEIQTVTIAFEEFGGTAQDEAPIAEEVAALYGTRQATRVVTQPEFEADLPRIMEAMDQPSIDGINTWFVAKAARERGLKVAISGLGGDELLGGYPSFRDIPHWVRLFAIPGRVPMLGKAVRILSAPLMGLLGLNPKAAGMLELAGRDAGAYLLKRGLHMPWELGEILDRDVLSHGLRRLNLPGLMEGVLHPCPPTGFGRVATLESSLYMRNQLLRDTDWASMAHAIEVRVPLVDSVLLRTVALYSATFAAGQGKRLLGTAPSRPLPTSVMGRAKTGFTTPVETWMRLYLEQPNGKVGAQRTRSRPWARDWSRLVENGELRPA